MFAVGNLIAAVVLIIPHVDGVLLSPASTSSMAATTPILNHRYYDSINHFNRIKENRRRENHVFSSKYILPGSWKNKNKELKWK